MSSSKAFIAVSALLLAGLLAGCGFEPVYGTKTEAARTVAAALPNIEVANIPDRDGQYLRNLLIDHLYRHGRPDDAPYVLKFAPITKDIVNLGVRKDATATRAQIQVNTQMKLVDKATNKTVLTRELKSVGAYNLLDNQFATLVSQRSITESLLGEVKDNAVTELSLYFRRVAVREPAAPAAAQPAAAPSPAPAASPAAAPAP